MKTGEGGANLRMVQAGDELDWRKRLSSVSIFRPCLSSWTSRVETCSRRYCTVLVHRICQEELQQYRLFLCESLVVYQLAIKQHFVLHRKAAGLKAREPDAAIIVQGALIVERRATTSNAALERI